MIPFNRPFLSGQEQASIAKVLEGQRFAGPGPMGAACAEKLSSLFNGAPVLITSSCTHALEMCALLADIQAGDEIIMPSYTFVSAANAFVLRGGVPVFVDILPGDMNIDPVAISAAITPNTKAILVMHYAGMACDMEAICSIADAHGLVLIEDAAHCIGASALGGQPLGTFGDLATFSFHETKNIHCGEGGALIVNKREWLDKARRIQEKGTNRPAFMRGEVPFYEWTDIGSSYILGELSTAFLVAQLEGLPQVTKVRRKLFDRYMQALSGLVELPDWRLDAFHNGHIFFIRLEDRATRDGLMAYLKEHGVLAYFHYIPLHASEGGFRFGRFIGIDQYTTKDSERLLRLPIYPALEISEQDYIIQCIKLFFAKPGSQR